MMNRIDIKKIEQEIELELISSMKRNLKRHLKEEKKTGFDFPQWQAETLKEIKRFQKENKSIVRDKTSGLNSAISKQLQNELKQGSKREMKKYKEVMGSKYKANKSLSHSFFKLNDKKLTNLIDEVQNGTKLANYGALRMMDDQYRKVISKAVMFSNYGAVSPTKAIDMATKDFLNAGINCIEYKNGTRVNIASYCDMAVRTANTRAQLIGEGQFRQEIGEHLVKPTRHNTSCEKCAKWEGKVLIDDVYSGGSKKNGKYPLLSEAMAQGFFHPRCEHSLPTYYKEVDDVEFDEHGPTKATMKQYQEDLNWINNNIQRYERLVAGSLDEENIKKYKNKRSLFEKKKEEVLKIIYESKYTDATSILKTEKENIISKERRLNYSLDKDGTKHYDFFFDKDDDIMDEILCQRRLEEITGYKVYLNPKTHTQNKKTPDFWIEDTNELWDLKGIDGNAKEIIDNILNKACKSMQAENLILKQRDTSHEIEYLKSKLKYVFDNNHRKKIKQVILLDRNNDVIAYYKR